MLHGLLLLHFSQCDPTGTTARQNDISIAGWQHFTNNTSAGGNDPGLESLSLWIEAYKCVWLLPGLAIPHDVIYCFYSIGPGLRPSRGGQRIMGMRAGGWDKLFLYGNIGASGGVTGLAQGQEALTP